MARIFLNALLGPPTGGGMLLAVLTTQVPDVGSLANIVGYLALSYVFGIVPALINGVFAATLARLVGRPLRVASSPVTGAVATALFGWVAFGGLVNSTGLALLVGAGALSSLVCGLAADRLLDRTLPRTDPATPP